VQAKAASSPAAEFRKALAQYATGVTIVTTRAPDGTPVGLTVNSFTSVSLDPPLVLWNIARSAASYDAFVACERYLVHVLAADQLDLARQFATRGAAKFDGPGWHTNSDGLPQLDRCVALFACAQRAQHLEGDHAILVGRVEAFRNDGGRPLIFHDSRYVTDLAEKPLPAALRKSVG
jgi:flavin reductase (DIM6/NTAB) family NADH-FMN oxidoreductase RutF